MARRTPRRAKIAFTDSAATQIGTLAEDEIHALDRALAALSVDPEMGSPIPGSEPELRRYDDDVDDVSIIYFPTALRTVIVIAYIEV